MRPAESAALLQMMATMMALIVGLAGCATTTGSTTRQEPSANEQAAALQVQMGQGYLKQGDYETARDKLKRALELDPNSVDGNTVMGVLQETIGRSAAAEKYYRRAVELKPEDGAVNNNYGTFLCGVGRYEEAQQHFTVAIEDPFYRTPVVAYANAGLCAAKGGDDDLAERALRSALALQPNNAPVLFELARLSMKGGQPMRSRAFLQRFEAVAAADPQALALAATVEQALGDNAAAERYRQQLQLEFPDYPTINSDSDGASPQ